MAGGDYPKVGSSSGQVMYLVHVERTMKATTKLHALPCHLSQTGLCFAKAVMTFEGRFLACRGYGRHQEGGTLIPSTGRETLGWQSWAQLSQAT